MVKHVYLGLFVIFLVLTPVYVFGRGLPQPPDLLMAFLMAILVTGFVIRIPVHMDLYLVAGAFLAHVIIVNLFWWVKMEEAAFALHAAYYTFNFGSFVVIVSLLKEFRERFITVCQVGFAIAVVFEIIALFVLSPATYRSVGTFYNPNQLGYWALLVSCCIVVLKRDQRLSLVDFAVLCGAGYLTAASLSKGAMLSFVTLLVLALVCQRPKRPVKVLFLALAFVGTTAALADTALIERFLSQGVPGKIAERLSDIGGQADDTLAGRGYDRIWRYPEHLVFGAGEGAHWRFSLSRVNPQLDQLELHSTLGTVLFSYGIVGFALFLALLAVVFRRAPLAHALYSLPIWMYGMTHQGLRDTMLWVFLALVFGLARYAPRPLSRDPTGRSPMPALPISRGTRPRTLAARPGGN